MALKKNVNRKMFYSMGEVCEMFDLPASTIRFWETRFRELSPRKNAKGNRQFTPSDLEKIKMIHNLVKERGMTIEGAQLAMKREKGILKANLPTIELLQQVRSALMALRDEIDDMVGVEEPVRDEVIIEHVEAEVEEPKQDDANKRVFVQHSLFDLGEFNSDEIDESTN